MISMNVKLYKRHVKKLLRQGLINKPCYIFGADNLVNYYKDILNAFNVDVVGVLDNDSKKWGKYVCRLPIVPVANAVGAGAVVLIANAYWRAMALQLNEMGLAEGEDFFVIRENMRHKEHYFLSARDLVVSLYKVFMGMHFSKRIVSKFGNDKIYFINHIPSLGDIYVASMFIPGYLGCDHIAESNCVLIVNNMGGYKLAKALGFKDVELISKGQTEKIVHAMAATEGRVKINRLVFSAYVSCRHINYLDCHPAISFTDMFYPYLFNDNSGKCKITPPLFSPNSNRIAECFAQNKLVDGKTVVLSPYAGSFTSSLPLDFWENIAARLTDNGYSVCTNSAGEHEPPLKGTAPVFFAFDDSVAFMERAGGFIGIRSGLCDIISSAQCIKVILYEPAIAFRGMFFSINKMGLCDDAREYSYEGVNNVQLIQEIMGNFPNVKEL